MLRLVASGPGPDAVMRLDEVSLRRNGRWVLDGLELAIPTDGITALMADRIGSNHRFRCRSGWRQNEFDITACKAGGKVPQLIAAQRDADHRWGQALAGLDCKGSRAWSRAHRL